jgi:hypothetical protein
MCDMNVGRVSSKLLIANRAPSTTTSAGKVAMKKYKLVCTLDFGDVLIQTLIWIALVVVTFGIALPFFAYFFFRLIINKTELHEIA